jgi:hypothetical protein
MGRLPTKLFHSFGSCKLAFNGGMKFFHNNKEGNMSGIFGLVIVVIIGFVLAFVCETIEVFWKSHTH